jgi:hypothetical protein
MPFSLFLFLFLSLSLSPPPPLLPSKPRRANSRPSSVQRVGRARLTCLAVLQIYLDFRQSN